jgi:hypothetical protein
MVAIGKPVNKRYWSIDLGLAHRGYVHAMSSYMPSSKMMWIELGSSLNMLADSPDLALKRFPRQQESDRSFRIQPLGCEFHLRRTLRKVQ